MAAVTLAAIACVQKKFDTSSFGALVTEIERSTKVVSMQVTNAEIATVKQFDLTMP